MNELVVSGSDVGNATAVGSGYFDIQIPLEVIDFADMRSPVFAAIAVMDEIKQLEAKSNADSLLLSITELRNMEELYLNSMNIPLEKMPSVFNAKESVLQKIDFADDSSQCDMVSTYSSAIMANEYCNYEDVSSVS